MLDTKNVLFAELVELTKEWNEFDSVPQEQQNQAKEIGKKLNELGGMTLMQDAYYHAKAANRCASVIQAYWDGIGLWKW